jgi:hypothetical protein
VRHTCVRRARILNDSRRTRANGTLYQHKDSRWEAAGYVFAPPAAVAGKDSVPRAFPSGETTAAT